MKKHSYRLTNVNKTNWEAIRTQTEGEAIIFSVDVAKKAFVGALVTMGNRIISTLKWEPLRRHRGR